MAGIKLLSITNITIVIFLIYLSYTANTFYSMFRPPTCKGNNCISPHFKPSANKKLKLYSCLSTSTNQPRSMTDSKCVTILNLDNFTINQSLDE